MKLGLHQSARLEQRLVQSPQMIQAMQILQLSGLDLLDRIQQELVENPFLEVEEGAAEAKDGGKGPEAGLAADGSAEKAPEAGTAAEPVADSGPEGETDGLAEELERLERDSADSWNRQGTNGEEGDRKLEAMANTPDSEKSLPEALTEELTFLDLDPRARKIAEYLVWSLDERGYLTQSLEEIAAEADAEEVAAGRDPAVAPITAADVGAVLERLRGISHPAIGARDLKECLRLQIAALGLEHPLLLAIVENHLEDLEQNRLPRIAKSTGKGLDAVKQAMAMLKTLDPHPGAGYGETRIQAITPDVIVEEQDGEYEVRLERQRIPRLALSPAYREFLRQAKKGDGVREWVKKRVEAARWFIEAVHQRQSTLQRIAQSIFVRQRGFLERGVEGFQPLRMQEVADEVGVHISTVSRAVAGKYAQTPRGIYPLKYFFAGGTQKASGEVASQVSIKQRIADLVAAEDPDRPLSDDELAKLLEEKDSVRIARRTVTKYRKALSIPSSNQRRKF
ncbi:MAG TPA: RNA polymerase factor sigma-54 [Planctomycetota bacterium]|nr:RNA polymerase factor sigma-54 [Planctomycetota bacterium]